MTPLRLRFVRRLPTGRALHQLQAPLVYRGQVERFEIPAGFRTDLASVPVVFWWLIPPRGCWDAAAVLHDWLYRRHLVSRADADGILRRTMQEQGAPLWQRWAVWGAVRAAGWLFWHQRLL